MTKDSVLLLAKLKLFSKNLHQLIDIYFQKCLASNEATKEIYYDKIPVLSESLSQYVIHFSAPLYAKGNISGVIATRYPVSKLNDIFRTFPVSGSETFNPIRLNLIANSGLVICSDYDRKSMLHDKLRALEIFKALTNNSGIDESDQRRVPVTIESTTVEMGNPYI